MADELRLRDVALAYYLRMYDASELPLINLPLGTLATYLGVDNLPGDLLDRLNELLNMLSTYQRQTLTLPERERDDIADLLDRATQLCQHTLLHTPLEDQGFWALTVLRNRLLPRIKDGTVALAARLLRTNTNNTAAQEYRNLLDLLPADHGQVRYLQHVPLIRVHLLCLLTVAQYACDPQASPMVPATDDSTREAASALLLDMFELVRDTAVVRLNLNLNLLEQAGMTAVTP